MHAIDVLHGSLSLPGSDLEHLALLLRLAAMTGREIAAAGSMDKDEILELVDRAEDVGRQLDAIAQRRKSDPLRPNRFVQVTIDKKH